jgi:hypoxanthine phosphoribosyltransferase
MVQALVHELSKSLSGQSLVTLISQAEIAAIVDRLATELDRDYAGRTPVLVGLLKGSFVFVADLARAMKTSLQDVEFMRLSSYGSGTVSSGQATLVAGLPRAAIAGQDVIVVEDIVDTGITISTVLSYLREYQPASLKLCTLLDKPARRQIPVPIDYVGITIPDQFVVGYGIDYDQQYRQLPDIYTIE